jgi:hypothetical protein
MSQKQLIKALNKAGIDPFGPKAAELRKALIALEVKRANLRRNNKPLGR